MSVSEPGKIITPWAESGLKSPIPPAANPATGRAGFDQGFSAINMTAKEAGGIPPFGQDFNGIFFQITEILRYMQAGGRPTFDAALATAIGGYPKGALVLGSDGVSVYTNIVDSNISNPNSGGSGWARSDLMLREALRRSYAEAGYNLVDGSFEAGGTLVNANDVLLQGRTGKGFSGPAGAVQAGTNPASGGFVDRSGELLRNQLTGAGGAEIVGTASGESIQSNIDNISLSSKDKPKGFAKEDGGSTALGVNYIPTMKKEDASSVSGTAGFNPAGEFTGDGSQNLAAWSLGNEANSFTCQGRIYFSAGVDNALIGYNSESFGITDLNTFYSVGFSSVGFVFNDKVELEALIPASLIVEGWYEVSMVYNSGLIFCSLCQAGTTKAKTFTINKTLPAPKNAQIGAFSAGDYVKDFRFSSSDSGNPWTPAFGGGRCIPLPITVPATNQSGVLISVHLPAGYDPRITHRLAVYCHGSGGTNTDLWDYPNENSILTSLLAAGYVVMTANYEATGWGNQLSISQNIAAMQYIKDRYNVFNKPYLVVQSMGGMVGLNTVLVGGITPSAIVGIYPASNLLWQYQNGFEVAIEGAYGFSGAANFETATAGYDALNDNAPRSFAGLKMKIWHSYQDTVVSRADNTDLLKTKVESGGGLVDVVTSSGEHGDQSSFDGSGIVEFFIDK